MDISCKYYNSIILEKNIIENWFVTLDWVTYFGGFYIFWFQRSIEIILLAVGSEDLNLANWLRVVSIHGLAIKCVKLSGYIKENKLVSWLFGSFIS